MFRDPVKGSELFPFIFVDVKREESNLLLLIGTAVVILCERPSAGSPWAAKNNRF
jgi:hypothetical protein